VARLESSSSSVNACDGWVTARPRRKLKLRHRGGEMTITTQGSVRLPSEFDATFSKGQCLHSIVHTCVFSMPACIAYMKQHAMP